MKKYQDERLQYEMIEMQAKLFRFMCLCFSIIFIIKLIMINDYSGFIKISDYFIYISTLIYGGYLLFSSKSDFYTPDKIYRPILGALFVGLIAMFLPMKENNFIINTEYLTIYLTTFLSGALTYAFAYIMSHGIKKWRHNRHQNQIWRLIN